MSYEPEPIDTSGVLLAEDVLRLAELLSRNTHEAWARGRLAEGWRYGPQRDDTRKQHPCLVPYDELPESEQQYDRTTALEALKVMLALGYRIEPPAGGAVLPALSSAGDQELAPIMTLLSSPLDLAALLALWRVRDPAQWALRPELYRLLGERSLKLGEPLLAYDAVSEGLERQPQDVRLQQLQGLALARSGATGRANQVLLEVLGKGQADEETLGMLARTHKDFWLQVADPAERKRQLRLAHEYYQQAYELSGGYWTGVNAATTALLLGQAARARTLAAETSALCLEELARLEETGGDPYWCLATLGEASLILGDSGAAEEWYGRAAEAGRGRHGDIASTRRNARLLLQHLGGEYGRVERILAIPPAIVFAGHMIDRPGRPVPRFPPELEPAVRESLRARLQDIGAGIGYASAACGADILFLEAILDRGGEAYVVLPYDREQFMQDCVDVVPGADWRARYERVLARATEVITVTGRSRQGGGIWYHYAGLLLYGLASIRAELLETKLVPLAVWDGRQGDDLGGTASTVNRWWKFGHEIELINPLHLQSGGPHLVDDAPGVTPRPAGPAPDFDTHMMAMLFADAVHFSRLSEEQLPLFVRHFLGAIGELAAGFPEALAMRNTWGDGLYLVFTDVRAAGLFALALVERIRLTDWAEKGLPADLNLRIALHAGPVFTCANPVTGRTDYIGTQVSRAARIEPITPPGQVYASQEFAAMASAERVPEFICDYVGQTPLAKGFGTFPTYHVRRRAGGSRHC